MAAMSVPVRAFTGREAVNALFAFDIDALSTPTSRDLSLFLGEELTVGLCFRN